MFISCRWNTFRGMDKASHPVCKKTTVIRCRAVRETSVFRHNRDAVKGPPSTPQYDIAVMYGGFKEARGS